VENNNLGMLIGAFIIILVGVVLIGAIADSVSEMDDTIRLANNESLTWAGNDTAIALANADYILGSEIVYNSSYGTLTSGTDYFMTRGGDSSTITYTNVTADTYDTDKLNITYTHEGDNYLDDSTSRNLLGLVILFFALAILAVGYNIVIKAYNNLNL